MTKILEPLQLKHLWVKNRLVRSAVHSFLGNDDGAISDREYAMYEELAKHRIGMMITGHCSVSPQGMANEEQAAIYDDKFIGQFAQLQQMMAKYDVRLIVQINHAGERAIDNDDLAGVMARELKKGKHCRGLTIEEIKAVVAQFINAAYRLKQAEVDGIQIHAAHSYLLSRFIDETFNQRNDEYGGSIENRFRIVREIIEGIREKCGVDFPVLVKINSDTATNDENYEADMVYMLNEFKRLAVEVVELSGYDFLSQPKDVYHYYLERAARLKKAVDIPLSLVGGIRSIEHMEQVLAAGLDMVSLGRPLIAEPDFIDKLLEGQQKAKCVSCNRCFVMPKLKPGIRCVLNRKNK